MISEIADDFIEIFPLKTIENLFLSLSAAGDVAVLDLAYLTRLFMDLTSAALSLLMLMTINYIPANIFNVPAGNTQFSAS